MGSRRSSQADPFSRYFDQSRARSLWQMPEDDDPWDGKMPGFSRRPAPAAGGGTSGGAATPAPITGGGGGISSGPAYSDEDLDEMDAWFRDPNSRFYDPTYIRLHPPRTGGS